MHPGAMARRRAVAEERLRNALSTIGERAGVDPTPPPTIGANDVAVRGLFMLEAMADFAERLAGIEPGEGGDPPAPATQLTADELVAARIRKAAPRLSAETIAQVIVEVNREEAEEPLEDRILALDGVGNATRDKIIGAVQDAGVRPASGELPPPEVGE